MRPERQIDLNADLGEGFPHDERLLDVVTSANVCAGAYAGSAALTARTIAMAAERGVRIGAHVGYPDREGFGRSPMQLSPGAFLQTLERQLSRCEGSAADVGATVAYVKPHGALYHALSTDEEAADRLVALASARGVSLLHRRGSALWRRAGERGVAIHAEGFADRRYLPNGTLVPRATPGAVIEPGSEVKRQAIGLAAGVLPTGIVDSICVHGDDVHALRNATLVREGLLRAGYVIAAPKQA